jgi:hypothetical protein
MALFGGRRITRAGILFIIGVLVVGTLVTGGIFMVKNHGEAVRRDEAIKIAEQTLKDQSEVATQPVDAPESTEGEAQETGTDSGGAVVVANEKAEELPATGPEELRSLGQLLVVALLAFSASAYISSRRAHQHL